MSSSMSAGVRHHRSCQVLPPPDYFLLMLLWPHQVKYLRLTDNYSQLDTADRDTGKWAARRVNP
eukprot:11026659-Alexandrium_andersonii.AAC.1